MESLSSKRSWRNAINPDFQTNLPTVVRSHQISPRSSQIHFNEARSPKDKKTKITAFFNHKVKNQ